jgi:parallel beta-helix repeat protein
MKTKLVSVLTLTLAFAFSLQPLALLAQGSLTPPGAPGPTMKTLEQIEPRKAVSALPFAITNGGSYYLTTNLTGVAGRDGITVGVSDVTVELNGFALVGVPGSSNGVSVSTSAARVVVRNGALRNWGASGVNADGCDGCVLERLRVSGSGSWGIVSGLRSTVADCTAINNPGGGITTDYHSLVAGCLSAENGGNGFWCSGGGTVRNCLAMNNNGDGFSAGDVSIFTACTSRDHGGSGFTTGAGSVVSGCTATANGQTGIMVGENSAVKDCSVRSCSNGGIVAEKGSTVSGCALCYISGPAGIQTQAGCSILNNNCGFLNGDTPAIRVQSAGSRIEANNVYSNAWGIVVEGTGNFVFRNTASANSSGNYTNAPGNVVGQVINASGGVTITNANPWANFSF